MMIFCVIARKKLLGRHCVTRSDAQAVFPPDNLKEEVGGEEWFH